MRQVVFSLLFWFSLSAQAFSLFESSELSEFGEINNPQSQEVIDHSVWDQLLNDYILENSGIHYFKYAEVTDQDRARLEDYIDSLAEVKVTNLAPDEQFAYWVNLYNSVTIKLILDHYPLDSIKDISFDLLSWGPWDEPLVTVEERELSLNDIEHKILRPVFKDPRIHYVVNCASIGCPNLPLRAVTSATLEDQLELGARQFINHERGVLVEEDSVVLSKIFDWYLSDFGENEGELIEHLTLFADPELQQKLQNVKRVSDYEYDWNLNELSQ